MHTTKCKIDQWSSLCVCNNPCLPLCHINPNLSLSSHTLSLSFLSFSQVKEDRERVYDWERLTFPLRGFTFLGFHLKTTAAHLKPFPIWRKKLELERANRKEGRVGLWTSVDRFILLYQYNVLDNRADIFHSGREHVVHLSHTVRFSTWWSQTFIMVQEILSG